MSNNKLILYWNIKNVLHCYNIIKINFFEIALLYDIFFGLDIKLNLKKQLQVRLITSAGYFPDLSDNSKKHSGNTSFTFKF